MIAWKIDIICEDGRRSDGSLSTPVQLFGFPPSLCLAGYVVQYDDEHPFVDELVRNDVHLPSYAARKVLTAIFEAYGHGIAESGSCWLTRQIDLNAFLENPANFATGGPEI